MTSRLEGFQASLQEAKRRLRIPELWAKLGLENPPSALRRRHGGTHGRLTEL